MIARSEQLVVDTTGAAVHPDDQLVRRWLSARRVFISSAMADTADERRAVADAVRDVGATPVWFEDFGGREADAEAAYTEEVDRSHIYLGIFKEQYGRQLPSGYSATQTEYLRATERGLRISLWSATDAPGREGHLVRFLRDVEGFHVVGRFRDAGDLASRVRRRLEEIAAEELCPWVKLGPWVFRADRVEDAGGTVEIAARPGAEVARALQEHSDQPFGSSSTVRFAYEDRVVGGQLNGVQRTVEAGTGTRFVIRLDRCQPAQGSSGRFGTAGLSADDLVEARLRALFFHEPLPAALTQFGGILDVGLSEPALQTVFLLSEEIVRPVARVVISDGLVGSGCASAIILLELGTRMGDRRPMRLEWIEPRTHTDQRPASRCIAGTWQPR